MRIKRTHTDRCNQGHPLADAYVKKNGNLECRTCQAIRGAKRVKPSSPNAKVRPDVRKTRADRVEVDPEQYASSWEAERQRALELPRIQI